MKTSKKHKKDVFKRSLENFFASGGSADVLMKTRKLHMRSRDCIWTVPWPATRKCSSPGAPACPWGPSGIKWTFPEQLWERILTEDLRYKFYGMRRGQFYRRQAKGCRNGSRRTSRRCRRWRSGLPAHITTAFWPILCGASLGYWSMQSLTTKLRASSKRWRRWWRP